MIGAAELVILNGSITVPATFCGQHFKGTPNTTQGKRIHSHDMQGVRWWEVNTSNGVYDWSTLDAKISAWGAGPWTYCMFGTPTWASARPTEPHAYGLGRMAEPSSMAYLTSFVTALVNRYPTLTHVEVWNEPDIPSSQSLYWYSGTVATFVTMCQTIYNAVKAANPAVLVCGPGSTYYLSSPNWLDAFFVAGGAAYLDQYSIHGYQLQYGTPHKAMLGTFLNVKYLKESIAKNGAAVKPICISEFGQINPIPSTLTDDQVINAYKRAMVIAAALGLTHANWYQYDDSTFGYSTRTSVASAVSAFASALSGGTLDSVRVKIASEAITVTGNLGGVAFEY